MELISTKSFKLSVNFNGNAKSNKLALFLPGKLDTKDYAHMVSHVNYFANLGFFALSFDPPGTWESKGDISLYNMTNYLKAIDELIEHFGNRQTFVMGHSRGATMAVISGTRNPNVFAYVSIMSTLTKGGFQDKPKNNDWEKTGFYVSNRDLPPGGGPEIKEFKLPFSFALDQLNYDLTEDITNCKKPKLIIYGKNDALATPEIVNRTFNLLTEPKELHEIDCDHDYRLKENMINEVNNLADNFINKYGLQP